MVQTESTKSDPKTESEVTLAKVVGNHEFDLYLMGNSLDSDPDPKPYWHSTAMSDEKGVYAWNIAGFQNADADSLMEAGLATTDQNERTKIYNDFGVLMNKELPWVTLYSKDIMMAHNPHLKNYNTVRKAHSFRCGMDSTLIS